MDANIGRREKSNCFFPSFLPQRVTTGVIFYSEVVFPRIRRVPRTRIDTTKPEKDAEWNNLRGRYTREFLSKKRIYKKKRIYSLLNWSLLDAFLFLFHQIYILY